MDEGAKLSRGVILAFGALVAALVFANAAFHVNLLLREADLWWHIKSGLEHAFNLGCAAGRYVLLHP